MLSLRVIALFVVTLAGTSLAKDAALPIKISFGMGIQCSGTTISDTQFLTPADCASSLQSSPDSNIKVRPLGITINDSGDIYQITRIVFHPERDQMDMTKEYVIVTVDRKIDAGKGVKAPKLAKEDVSIPEGEILTTVKTSLEPHGISYYWYDLVHQNVKAINEAKCKELSPDWSDDYICIDLAEPNDNEYIYNPCQGDEGAPLVWNGQTVGISTSQLYVAGDLCTYRKIYSLLDFIEQNIEN